jgi:hypothetical protein
MDDSTLSGAEGSSFPIVLYLLERGYIAFQASLRGDTGFIPSLFLGGDFPYAFHCRFSFCMCLVTVYPWFVRSSAFQYFCGEVWSSILSFVTTIAPLSSIAVASIPVSVGSQIRPILLAADVVSSFPSDYFACDEGHRNVGLWSRH